MRLVNPAMHGQDLGALWREAEQLGMVEVGQESYRQPPLYKVQIKFSRERSGSTVWATGISPVIEHAMGLAIAEAHTLGGGRQQ